MLNFGRSINPTDLACVRFSCIQHEIGCLTLEIICSSSPCRKANGGGEGVRTPDLRLAKPALCQTELRPHKRQRNWLRGRDLNPRPLGYEPNELPDCSTPRHTINLNRLVGLGRFELPTSRLSGVRSNQLSYRPLSALLRRVFSRKKEPHFLIKCGSVFVDGGTRSRAV